MRVALLSYNAQFRNAVGNHIAEKVRFFRERGADVRLFVQDARRLHPEVRWCARELAEARVDGPAWEYLTQADLVFAVYGQYYDLLQWLPRLAGTGPRIVFDYLGVTPPQFWNDQHREGLEKAAQMRSYIWCADHALAISDANRRELHEATNFPAAQTTTLPLAVDVRLFQAVPSDRYLQQRLGIDGRILLFVGRLAENKRVPLLIAALAQVADRTVHAVIAGDCRDVYAAEAARCLARARELGLERRVHVIGELSETDLARAYRSADVFVMPSVHEGFCVPILEAMAAGCPVIASRSEALPETVGDAGLTFEPGNADDLARQIQRVLGDAPPTRVNARPSRIAFVSFRFGDDFVGGAEASMRTMAKALQSAGNHVEVFTTCATTEQHWRNDLTPGTTTLDGLTIHRFPIDAFDDSQRDAIESAIAHAGGKVVPAMQERYLDANIHSTPLIAALDARRGDFDAIITGPYFFGLSADKARRFPDRTLVVPCFHDEPRAHMSIWPRLYGNAGGVLYHSTEEQQLAQARLGVNHPNSTVIGTFMAPGKSVSPFRLERPYVVYCGRYIEEKNVRLLLEWARQFQNANPDCLDFVFMGQGDIHLPREPWLHDLGFVSDDMKRSVIAGSTALVQLSCNESLSLVALEAWAEGVPVIVHRNCAVLSGQIERSQGGAAVADYSQFRHILKRWLDSDDDRRRLGANGRAYVEQHYASPQSYVATILTCVDRLRTPIRERMRERGQQRACEFTREGWQARFAEFVEKLLTQPARPRTSELLIEPLRAQVRASGTSSLLLPVRLINRGSKLAAAEGPGRTLLCCEIRAAMGDATVLPCAELPLPAHVMPGQAQVVILPIEIPTMEGAYSIRLWTEERDRRATPENSAEITLIVDNEEGNADSCLSAFLETIARTLPQTYQLQQLPTEYVDVTEGTLAPVKRFLKKKVLNNFKHAYVDVLSRQQSQLNSNVVTMIQQLVECCTLLDQRLAALENSTSDVMEEDTVATNARRQHG